MSPLLDPLLDYLSAELILEGDSRHWEVFLGKDIAPSQDP
jgi:hypothetical protein